MASVDLYVCNTNALVSVNGERVMLRKGVTIVRKGHALLKEHGAMFEPLHVHYDVEQATAAPGERRSLSLPRPKKADDEPKGDADV
jgi:hypothetical protein